ncbi:MAG: alpha/beta fold hydrolase [Nocardioides sp.]|nr:alpha/beta fold hydrolase [Nocardioidaceae bacterium]MCB8958131.1 alpha/beta fold hydrolase [Nocardioides sp.]
MRVPTNGIELSVQEAGSAGGRPLVLLHALGESAADWDGVVPALMPGRRALAVDLRGHGASDRPGNYSLELMRDDVLGLLDALRLASVDLVGHSLGGLVALLVAEAAPSRVDRLVLEDVPAPLPRVGPALERPPGDLDFDWDMVLAVRPQIDTPDPAWLEGLSRITADTLVVYGGTASPMPRDRVEELVRRVPRARMVTVEAGHLVHATRPEEFVGHLLDFLGAA